MSELIKRRDELRRLSELRGQVGLSPYPDAKTISERAIKQNISPIEAYEQLMHEGERILQEAEQAAAEVDENQQKLW